VLIGLGGIVIVLSILLFIHPGMTDDISISLLGIILIIVGIEKIISGIFVTSKSRWGTVGLGALFLIFGWSVAGIPIFGMVILGFLFVWLLPIGISNIVNGLQNKESPCWARRSRIGAGALAITLFLLVMVQVLWPSLHPVNSLIVAGLAPLIKGIEIIIVASTRRGTLMVASPGR
jgi:uncharacterized membrane protein HdeD (DUF308 family)